MSKKRKDLTPEENALKKSNAKLVAAELVNHEEDIKNRILQNATIQENVKNYQSVNIKIDFHLTGREHWELLVQYKICYFENPFIRNLDTQKFVYDVFGANDKVLLSQNPTSAYNISIIINAFVKATAKRINESFHWTKTKIRELF